MFRILVNNKGSKEGCAHYDIMERFNLELFPDGRIVSARTVEVTESNLR